jgi:hypothetical protein
MARTPLISIRDRELLAFLAEQRVATTRQLERLLGVSRRTIMQQVSGLDDRRLLVCEEIFADEPAAVRITRTGLCAIERELPPPRLNLQAYRHDTGVGSLWLAAREGAFGPLAAIVSEREMRSHDGRPGNELDGDKYGVGLWRAPSRLRRGPGSNRHYPDLLLQSPRGYRVALELELTGKSDARLREIMSAYTIDRRYARVMYLVPDRRLARRIESAARWAGAQSFVAVQLVRVDDRPRQQHQHARERIPARRRTAVAR